MNIFQLFVITTTTVGLLGCANSSTSYSKKQTKAPLELLLGTWNCSIYDDSDPEMTVNATFIKSITKDEIIENGIVKFDVEVEKDTPISFEKEQRVVTLLFLMNQIFYSHQRVWTANCFSLHLKAKEGLLSSCSLGCR